MLLAVLERSLDRVRRSCESIPPVHRLRPPEGGAALRSSGMSFLLIPLFILLAILVTFGIVVLLARFRNGRYLRPIIV